MRLLSTNNQISNITSCKLSDRDLCHLLGRRKPPYYESAHHPVCVVNPETKFLHFTANQLIIVSWYQTETMVCLRWRFRHRRCLITGRANWHRMGAVIITPHSGAVSIAILSHELNFYATAHLLRLPPTEEARYRLPCGWMTSSTYRFHATCRPNCLRVRTGATGIQTGQCGLHFHVCQRSRVINQISLRSVRPTLRKYHDVTNTAPSEQTPSF